MRESRWIVAMGLLAALALPARAQDLLVVDSTARPGIVWSVSAPSGTPAKVYERPSGWINNIGWSPGRLFAFTDQSDSAVAGKIFAVERGREREIYDLRKRLVRDIVFDAEGNLYFSVSSGGARDGAIYRLPAGFDPGTPPETFYDVRLGQIEGYWGGDFVLAWSDGRGAEPTLYLGAGATLPGKLFRVRRSGGRFAAPELVLRVEDHAIRGLDIDAEGNLYYADNAQSVWTISTSSWGKPRRLVQLRDFEHLVDVSLAPSD